MTTGKFRNKYRIKSTRLEGYDYSQNGYYFVTICTKNRECFFGDIDNGEMQLSEIGKIAQKYFLEIPRHFPFVRLGEFVVMPNYFHGIIIIDKIISIVGTPKTVGTPKLGVPTVETNPNHKPQWKSRGSWCNY